MNVLILSDLHLEFCDLDVDANGIDVVVLAGDIHTGDQGLGWIKSQFKDLPVIYVPGNHEYYRGEFHAVLANLRETAQNAGIHLLERDAITIGDVQFLGTTLWTDMAFFGYDEYGDPSGLDHANLGLNDFRLISFEQNGTRRRFSAEDSVELHHESAAWLEETLKKQSASNVFVITHHAPSANSVAARYSQDPLTAAFASKLDHLVEQADFWVHGHTHDSFDYRLSKCRVICNPRGYTRSKFAPPENTQFQPRKIISI